MALITSAAAPALSPRPDDVLVVRRDQLRLALVEALAAAWLREMDRVPPLATREPAGMPGVYRVPRLGPWGMVKRFHTDVVHARARRRRMRDEALALGLAATLVEQLLRRFDLGWTTSSIRDAPSHDRAARMVAFLVG